MEVEALVRKKWRLLKATMDERARRLWAGSLQAPNKAVEGKQHPDRNAQFEHINAKAEDCLKRGVPVLSVDTKKKELVGNFRNAGREWQPEGEPELVDVHDFPDDAVGKAIPYGVYDVGANDGFVSVGTDHDTPASLLERASRRDQERQVASIGFAQAEPVNESETPGG